MRRNRRRHADRDPRRAIGQQVRKSAGQNQRLFIRPVIRVTKINRALVDILQDQFGGPRQARFGVAHGRSIIAVDIAEIALPLDQRIARGEILREADHGVIDRLITMRVKAAHHVTDDAGGLLERFLRVQFQQPHRVQDAPMNRLHAVAGIGQCALGNRRQRIGEIALGQRLVEGFFKNLAAVRRYQLAHVSPIP